MTFGVTGLDEVKRALSTLTDDIAKDEAVAAAVARGAVVIQREARRLAPRRRGKLRRNIRIKRTKMKGGVIIYQVGVRGGLGHLVEFGTAPHTIRASYARRIQRLARGKGAGVKMVLTDGKTFFGPEVQHPGTSPQPFLRPAFDSKTGEAIEELKRHIWAGVQKAARRGYAMRSAARKAARVAR